MKVEVKEKEFNLKEFKLTNKQGAFVEWNYMFAKQGVGHQDVVKVTRTLTPHNDLLKLLKDTKDMVIKCEDIDYANRVMKIPGIKASTEVEQGIKGAILDIKSKIEVTGIKLSGKDDHQNAVITYKKITGNKKIAGRATTAILLSGSVYGFEEELQELIKKFIREVYSYIYGNKFADVEQACLYPEEAFSDKPKKEKPAKPKEEDKPAGKEKPEPKKPEPKKEPAGKKQPANKKA